MSKSDCEIWFTEWFPGGTSPEVIEKVNRGPNKAVMEFLIKRAKTDNAIEVLRSNLYIHRKQTPTTVPVGDGGSGVSEEKIKVYGDWEKRESVLVHNIEDNMKKLFALDVTLRSFSTTMEKKRLITTMRETLTVIGGFLVDVNEIKSKNITSEERLKTLDALLEEALKIFQDIFFRRGAYEPNQLDWSKIEKIIPSILCAQEYTRDIQRWMNVQRRQSEEKVYKRLAEMSTSIQPNPLAEWDRLVTKKLFMWTQCHVQLHLKNARLVDRQKAVCAKKREGQLRAMDTCRWFRSFPPDFFSLLLRREELKCQLRLCREVSSLGSIGLWEGNSLDVEGDSEGTGVGNLIRDRQLQSSKGNIYKNGAIEDMAVCLLKGWYNTKTRLFSTQDRVRQVYPEILLPAITGLLNVNDTQTTYNYSSSVDESWNTITRDFSQMAIKEKENETDTSVKLPSKDLFPSASVDLNPLISAKQELNCQSLKRGSSTADVLRDLLDNSVYVANSFTFSSATPNSPTPCTEF